MPLNIIRQDITKMSVDAIINTTNEEMIGYAGIDKAIHEGAGRRLGKACEKLKPLGLGQAKITKGYNLPAKYIIHTHGPVWQGGLFGETAILESCYRKCLELADAHKLKTIAFPLISSGFYGFPKDRVLKFAVRIISEFLSDHEMMVYLCVFDRDSYEFSKMLFDEISDFISNDNDTIKKKTERDCLSEFVDPVVLYSERPSPCMSATSSRKPVQSAYPQSLQEYMQSMDKSFAYKLFDYIDESGMTDVECYKKANVDKKTFSKIKCNPDTYKPSKQTAVAFAIALKLDISQTQDLLSSAGMTLSRSYVFDKIIMYFIQKKIYDVYEINEALFEFDQVLLGC